jgi:hypothetical protein
MPRSRFTCSNVRSRSRSNVDIARRASSLRKQPAGGAVVRPTNPARPAHERIDDPDFAGVLAENSAGSEVPSSNSGTRAPLFDRLIGLDRGPTDANHQRPSAMVLLRPLWCSGLVTHLVTAVLAAAARGCVLELRGVSGGLIPGHVGDAGSSSWGSLGGGGCVTR